MSNEHKRAGRTRIERHQLAIREHAEAERWAAAADDPEFRREMRAIGRDLGYAESRFELRRGSSAGVARQI